MERIHRTIFGWEGGELIDVRTLTMQGMEKFRSYIQSLKEDSPASHPDLNAEPDSQQLEPSIEISDCASFSSRMEMGKYLKTRFDAAGVKRDDVLGNHALWTWLAYTWFDDLCPIIKGTRHVLEAARYVCATDYRRYYRHLVAAPYDIFSRHGEEHSKLFLSGPIYKDNDFVEQIASRQYLISNPNVVEAAQLLYLDKNSESPKRGANTGKKPGTLRRFIMIMNQLELTYDIYTMSADRILDLLPREFDRWR